ncbi:hypothetical protein CSW47_11585 [Thermus scotoductus]|uniref:DUF11 domain-containing protein n=1 Tax=Thermus scotoductus TaxID=37636 RepID=A0A430R3M4_THESC|nr:hypothetical protein [Thermus scotoductus]RTH01996.1 hypothetical protein CSW47_11585 [Thermus scotoductus]
MTRQGGTWKLLLGMVLWAVALFPWATAQSNLPQVELKATLVGTGLEWELDRLEVWLVPMAEEGRIALFSPGFDPEDYRSALKGKEELGDERYDRGQGEVKATYELYREGTLLRRVEFGVEPHREVELFLGKLVPGQVYRLVARFEGLGKNAFVLRAEGFKVYLDPQAYVVDMAPHGAGLTLRQLPGQQGTFVELLALRVPEDALPLSVRFYDEDGPEELRSQVALPNGTLEERPVSGDREWSSYTLRLPGLTRFLFTQPPTARQYSNTLAFQVPGCLQAEAALPGGERGLRRQEGGFSLVPPGPRKVKVVDPEGNPLDLTPTLTPEGLATLALPQGYRLLEVRTQGAVKTLEGGRVLFGCPGGEATYVVEIPPAQLRVRVLLALPTGERPGEGLLEVRGEAKRVEGEALFTLAPGTYPLALRVEGAKVEGPSQVTLAPGEKREVVFRLFPQVNLTPTPETQRQREGEVAQVVLEATTSYPGLLPGELSLELPEDLEALTPTRITGPLSKNRPLRLTVDLKGPKGTYVVKGRLQPHGLEASGQVEFFRQATFTLHKEALTPKVAQGEEARFRLTVVNRGDEAGWVILRDPGGAGLEGPKLEERIYLEAHTGKSYEVAFRATGEGLLLNRAELLSQQGEVLARAEASVEVLLPKPALARELPFQRYLPGEEVRHRLVVRNLGEAPMRYILEDTCPDFLEPREARFEGTLPPGGERVHTYTATVRFGPEAQGTCRATLHTSRGNPTAEASVARVLLSLKKEALPARVLEGNKAAFLLTVTNLADHAVRIRLLDTPPKGLSMEALDRELALEAGETRILELPVEAVPAGVWVNRASAFLGDSPVAFPAEATLAGLPLLIPERISEVRLPYQVQAAQGEELLLAFPLPPGAQYIPGSARHQELPLEDPLVYEQEGAQTLYWRLPFAQKGEVRFLLQHERALPPMGKPGLTLLSGGREVALEGKATLEEYRKAKPLATSRSGVIRQPQDGQVFRDRDAITVVLEAPLGPLTLKVNGQVVGQDRLGKAELDEGRGWQRLEYYGVPLAVGKNLLEVEGVAQDRVEVFRTGNPVRLRLSLLEGKADGRTPIRVRVEALDENGLPSGFGPVTVETDLEPLNPDAFLEISGYQILLKDGRAELLLKPLSAPREFTVRAEFNRIEAKERFFPGERREGLWLAQGSVGVALKEISQGLSLENLRLFGLARAYAEGPVLGGQGQLALDTAGGLAGKLTPERFPVTGAATEAKRPLTSDDPIAFRYDQAEFSIAYERAPLGAALPEATALRFATRGATRLEGFLGLLPWARVQERITPDGTSYYRLSQPPKPGSVSLILVEGARETRLVEGKDYVVDDLGNIQLSRPLFPTTPSLAPVYLLAEYAPVSAPRDLLAYGLGATYEEGGFRFGVSAAYLGSWRYGLEAGYAQGLDRLGLSAGYAEGRFRLAFGAEARLGAFRLQGDLRTEDIAQGLAALQGQARLAYEEGSLGVALEHTTPAQSALLLEYRPKPFTVGAGLGYMWNEAAWAFLGRAGYEEAGAKVLLTHSQAFGLSKAISRLEATLPLDPNLSLEAGLAYPWGEGLSGTLGLRQRLAGANLSLSYQLPTASGEGNRARFGVEAPLPLTDTLSLNLTAGLERNLNTGTGTAAFGLAARYKTETLSATLGGEVSLGQETKLVLKGGAAGSLDEENTLSVDGLYQVLPKPEGRFTVAYALFASQMNLLTYHRILLGNEPLLEGELISAYHQPGFQIRPGLAYRIKPQDPLANTYQFGLGANLYLTERFGLGGAGYYVFQPGTGQGRFVYSVEGSLRVLEGLWFNLGYSFGETLLQPEGLYLRLDFFGGSR